MSLGLGPALPIQTTIRLDGSQFSAAVNGLSNQITCLENKLSGASRSMGASFNGNVTNPATAAFGAVSKLAGVLGVGYLVSRVVDLISAFGRMDTMTNYNRTMTAITGSADIAKASLETLKGVTLGTAYGLDVAAKATQGFVTRGMDMGNATNQVRVWADAVSFYGSGTNEALANTIDAWQNMYARGKVTMVQLNRVLQEGIPVIDIYAKAVGKSTAQVMDAMGKEGLTATQVMSVVTKAMDEGTNGVLKIAGAAKDAGNTWATTWANMRAAATRGIISVIEAIDAGLEEAGMGTVMGNLKSVGTSIENTFKRIAGVVAPIVVDIANAIRWVGNNMSWIGPIIGGVAIALTLFSVATKVASIGLGIYNTAMAINAARTMLMGTANFAATASQYGLNAAMLACPVTWVIAGIVVLAGAIYGAVVAINHFAGTSYSAVGTVAGVFSYLAGFIINSFIFCINMVLDYFINPLTVHIRILANFIGNVFNNPVAAVEGLFLDLTDFIIGRLKTVSQAMDGIFGTNLTAGLNKWSKSIDDRKITLGLTEFSNAEGFRINANIKATDWYGAGYGAGKNFKNPFKMPEVPASPVNANNFGGMPNSLNNIDKNTSKMAKELKDYKEEVKYIQDFATRKATHDMMAQRTVVIDMKNSKFEVKSDVDINTLADTLGRRMLDRMGS